MRDVIPDHVHRKILECGQPRQLPSSAPPPPPATVSLHHGASVPGGRPVSKLADPPLLKRTTVAEILHDLNLSACPNTRARRGGQSPPNDGLSQTIHIKKWNRLLHRRLNAIVFVSYNRKMNTRFQIRQEKKGKSFDPLVIDEFHWDNEWADSLPVPPQGGRGCDCDLTWEQVYEAVGASQSLHGRNVPRRAHMNSRGGPITYSSKRTRNSVASRVLEDEVLDCTSEGEEDDPHDDADVSD
ncbi:hypothetical protein PR202_gb00980 [Eleusine coracana subsp. coracana]|uniref:Uncharacterized protein n=1 Tax=Eleusine coracana subsp. coracana TaxID=191504 RepID=A0AAV5DT04_ELECO|nr:hypothetical protein PR202_gb00980 [Eleusine coracana subsp. coracana]